MVRVEMLRLALRTILASFSLGRVFGWIEHIGYVVAKWFGYNPDNHSFDEEGE